MCKAVRLKLSESRRCRLLAKSNGLHWGCAMHHNEAEQRSTHDFSLQRDKLPHQNESLGKLISLSCWCARLIVLVELTWESPNNPCDWIAAAVSLAHKEDDYWKGNMEVVSCWTLFGTRDICNWYCLRSTFSSRRQTYLLAARTPWWHARDTSLLVFPLYHILELKRVYSEVCHSNIHAAPLNFLWMIRATFPLTRPLIFSWSHALVTQTS